WMLTYFIFMARNILARNGLSDREGAKLDSYLKRPDLPFSALKDEAYRHLPLRDWGDRMSSGAPYFADYLRNSTATEYWAATDIRPLAKNVAVPALHVGSWYDAFQFDTLSSYLHFRDHAANESTRRQQRLIMGPWAHLLPYSVPTSGGTGDIDFGPDAKIELHAIQERWFRHHFDGSANKLLDEPPVRIFVMGENRWRDEWEWPLKRTRYTNVYLHGGGRANSANGDGRLSLEAPGAERPDHFTYDPNDPVPTRGGTVLGLPPGVHDQRPVESRRDVLVYTGDVLTTDMEVTGPIVVKLFAESSASDTDFTAKLVDVRPDGYAHNIAEGVVRARFRESIVAPTLITPGKAYEYTIDLWATSHLFNAGHRLRLEISSSNFPRYDRNPNTGHDFGVDAELTVAHQTVLHDANHRSHVVLPIIPR
ncbi:MAG: CocE/NonD family hydrolase, partial [Candidatus Binataceae bacterium]